MLHNIMIVDDEPSVLRAIERQLQPTGHHIVSCASAEEALAKLACFDISVLLTDNLMLDMTGVELLKIVRHRFPQVVRVLLTAHADLETAMSAINQGEIWRFLMKPWDAQQLVATLAEGIVKHEKASEASRLVDNAEHTKSAVAEIEKQFPGITDVDRDDKGNVILS